LRLRDTTLTDPPESLLEAMRVFFVGLAARIIGKTGRRSMLIHPATEKLVHQRNAQWATAAKDAWLSALSAPANDPDRKEAIDDFRKAYDELAKTERSLPPFDQIMEKMPRALQNTTVIEFNTRGSPKTPEIADQLVTGM
jgi:Z1 domain